MYESDNITIEDVIGKFTEYDNNQEDINLVNKAFDYAYKNILAKKE